MGVADAINVALVFAAVKRGPVAIALLTHYLAPLLVALTAPWVIGERRSMRALLGAPLTSLGLALLIWKPGEDFSGWTALLGGASAIFFAITVFCAKEAARAWSPLGVTCVHAAVAALTLLLLFGRSALPPIEVPVLWVLAGCVVSGLIANILFNQGLRAHPHLRHGRAHLSRAPHRHRAGLDLLSRGPGALGPVRRCAGARRGRLGCD